MEPLQFSSRCCKNFKKPLTGYCFFDYNSKAYEKNNDEDSRIFPKIAASRRWCETGISRNYLKITSELQTSKVESNFNRILLNIYIFSE